jgi:hypothetical protein
MVTITALAPERRETTIPEKMVPTKMLSKRTGPTQNSFEENFVRFLNSRQSRVRLY